MLDYSASVFYQKASRSEPIEGSLYEEVRLQTRIRKSSSSSKITSVRRCLAGSKPCTFFCMLSQQQAAQTICRRATRQESHLYSLGHPQSHFLTSFPEKAKSRMASSFPLSAKGIQYEMMSYLSFKFN